MKNPWFLGLICICVSTVIYAQDKVLIITGGHDFEEAQFFEMFDSFKGLTYDWAIQPEGNKSFEQGKLDQYDAIVFYDMFEGITEAQKAAYLHELEKGIGMVFLHHSLVSYQDWPEFQKIIGGKYLRENTKDHPKSTYKHDVDIHVEIVDKKHPITKNFNDFQIFDEVYGSFIVNKDVRPLLTTDHPESTKTIAWCHEYKKSRIVYLQSGHDHHAYENKFFRSLILNAIYWVNMAK